MKRITIPQYIKRVQISKSKKKKYFHTVASINKAKFAKEHFDKGKWSFRYVNGKPTLCDEKGIPVIANPKSHGKPNVVKVTTQGLDRNLLGLVKIKMYEFFEPFFEDLSFEEDNYPLRIRYIVYDTPLDNVPWDLDNRASVYRKVLQDIIKRKMYGADDNVLFITSYQVDYVPIENEDDRKIIIEIVKDERRNLLVDFFIKLRQKFYKNG